MSEPIIYKVRLIVYELVNYIIISCIDRNKMNKSFTVDIYFFEKLF